MSTGPRKVRFTMNKSEAARQLGVSRIHINRLLASGVLCPTAEGVHKSSVEALVRKWGKARPKRGRKPKPKPDAEESGHA